MERLQQSEIVLTMLKAYGEWDTLSLTKACLSKGIMRPAARVFDLRKLGHDIELKSEGKSNYYIYHGQNTSPQMSLL